MEYTKADYHGHDSLVFEFEGRQARLALPKTPAKNKPWILKTEYFWVFPSFEVEMLKRGWHIAHVASLHRWHDPSDDEIRHKFLDFLQKEFGLSKKCVLVGMSLGGLQAIHFASKFPQDVAGMYLDAPVINLLSCPCRVGRSTSQFMDEFTKATGMTIYDLMTYRNHPFDHFEDLAKENFPIFLVSGDSDKAVPYEENGKLLYDYYTEHGLNIKQIIKAGCDHHPHGLDDPTPLVDWALSLYKE